LTKRPSEVNDGSLISEWTGIPPEELNSIDNLILVCHECHEKIDATPDGGR
jgi:hypothetical protein